MTLDNFLRSGVALLVMALMAPKVVLAASYDCAKASTATEHAICDYPELSALDDLMGQAYRMAKTSADWMTPQDVNGGVKFGHCGGAKVGQFGASALERAALIEQARSKAHWPSGQFCEVHLLAAARRARL